MRLLKRLVPKTKLDLLEMKTLIHFFKMEPVQMLDPVYGLYGFQTLAALLVVCRRKAKRILCVPKLLRRIDEESCAILTKS